MSWAGTLVDCRDGVSWTAAGNSDTTPDFYVLGGRYAACIYSSTTASATLNIKTPSGHYVAAGAAFTSTAVFDLCPGTYQIVFGASAGTADGALERVPFRAA
jgi:hypothetical protein